MFINKRLFNVNNLDESYSDHDYKDVNIKNAKIWLRMKKIMIFQSFSLYPIQKCVL